MIGIFIIMFFITAGLSWLWASAIDKEMKYRKQNPDYNPEEGWLDWDISEVKTKE